MAKILVADDNSNIQKMVGLALKDQGIDVVAVGNGEAAVRKISAIHPDLVLADVFMPVRNGYEVCQYVKEDSALSHIPVILLVGAFDPLDEQEAQRVGADGVLKKPFVPPDPLISMVKSALSRVGAPNAATAAHEAPAPGVTLPTEAATPAAPAYAPEPETLAEPEPVEEAIPERPAPFQIDANAQPLAFGSLLGAPASEEGEEAAVVATIRPERDWHTPAQEDETDKTEEEEKQSWRRDAAEDALLETATPATGRRDWRDLVFGGTATPSTAEAPWPATPEPEHEEQEDPLGQPQANATASVAPGASAAPFADDAWSAAIAAGEDELRQKASFTEEFAPQAPASSYSGESIAENESASDAILEETPAEQENSVASYTEAEASLPAPSPSGWESEAQKASQLAATWDAPAAPPPDHAPPSHTEPEAAVQPAPEIFAEPELVHDLPAALSSEAVESIREEAAEEIVAETPAAATAHETVDEGPANAAPSVDEIVARVLAKLSPEVLHAVTREILKPVVEVIVREEIKSKQP